MTGSAIVLCVRGIGHLHPLLSVIEGLSARGVVVHVMTAADYREKIERCGGRFFDLYARYPIEAADSSSRPMPCRYVTFAGVYAERLTRDVAALQPSLVLYDTFSVAAPVVARSLGLPYVNMCANHALVPARAVAELRDDPRVDISPACWAAVQRLRTVHGMVSANPFSYVEGVSPFLNLYPEPEEFLAPDDRAALAPLAFFGALAPSLHVPGASPFAASRRGRRIFVSFGTVIWNYFAEQAYGALRALSAACGALDVDAVFSLGQHDLAERERAALVRPNVRVVSYADQWAALSDADVFVTHHGINSTHESIFHEVPMISYPFFGDQPALARRCQDLGLAVPLVGESRARVEAESLGAALARLDDDADGFRARLAEARSWELRTVAGRDAVMDRLLALADGG